MCIDLIGGTSAVWSHLHLSSGEGRRVKVTGCPVYSSRKSVFQRTIASGEQWWRGRDTMLRLFCGLLVRRAFSGLCPSPHLRGFHGLREHSWFSLFVRIPSCEIYERRQKTTIEELLLKRRTFRWGTLAEDDCGRFCLSIVRATFYVYWCRRVE